MKKFTKSTLALILPLSLSFAAISATLPISGELKDSNTQESITGTHSFNFTIYDEADGSIVWTENHSSIDVVDGDYHIILGSTSPIPDDAFSKELTLGVDIDSQGELSPRQTIPTTGKSYYAKLAGGIKGDLKTDALYIGDNLVINQDGEWVGANIIGSQGPKGEKGDRGEAGPMGPAGVRGDIGLTGPTGPKGSPGPTGPKGSPGPTGPKGSPGPTGPKGNNGDTGAAGKDGDTILVRAVTKSEQFAVTGNNTATHTLSCDATQDVINGGFSLSEADSANAVVYKNIGDKTGWSVGVNNKSGSPINVTLQVTCVPKPVA